MTRISPLAPADAFGSDANAAFAKQLMGYVPNSVLTMAHWPELLTAFRGLVSVIYGESLLDNGFKRLIGHATSLAAGCRYCQAHTAHGADGLGVSEARLAALHDFEESDEFTEPERAALALAFAAGASPNTATDAHFERLRPHYSNAEQVEIMAVISMFGFLNRWNDTLATSLETEPLEHAQGTLTKLGWQAGRHASE